MRNFIIKKHCRSVVTYSDGLDIPVFMVPDIACTNTLHSPTHSQFNSVHTITSYFSKTPVLYFRPYYVLVYQMSSSSEDLQSTFWINLSFPELTLHLKHIPLKTKLTIPVNEYTALNSPILSCPLSFNIIK